LAEATASVENNNEAVSPFQPNCQTTGRAISPDSGRGGGCISGSLLSSEEGSSSDLAKDTQGCLSFHGQQCGIPQGCPSLGAAEQLRTA